MGQVTPMYMMFREARAFNADLGAWDVGRVTSMFQMFAYLSAFNADLGAWQVGQVTNMHAMFHSASVFNADIGAWEVGQVRDMYAMFTQASACDADLSTWDIRLVTDMGNMFSSAAKFNQVLCWNLTGRTATEDMFTGSSGSADPISAKCNCIAGTFWNGTACASCSPESFSLGKSFSCTACVAGVFRLRRGPLSAIAAPRENTRPLKAASRTALTCARPEPTRRRGRAAARLARVEPTRTQPGPLRASAVQS